MPCFTSRWFTLAATLLIGLFLAPNASAGSLLQHTSDPTLAEEVTQALSLRRGWNWISLAVVPPDTRMETVLGTVLDDVVVVRDDEGNHYSPRYNVHTLHDWAWDQSYAVYVDRAVTLEVTGQKIDPAHSALTLGPGWNQIPVFSFASLPVSEALVSIEDALQWVEDDQGNAYQPGELHTLTHLEPGRGYRIHVSTETTLQFPSPESPGSEPSPSSEPGADRSAATLAEALAFQDLSPGQTIFVEGYHYPGDGAEGLFIVSNGGETPDWGTVFVPTRHQSQVQTHSVAYQQRDIALPKPSAQHLIPGSVTLHFETTNGYSVRATDHLLHGHRHASRHDNKPMLDYYRGVYDEHARTELGFLNNKVGAETRSGIAMFTYRHTTGPIRLIRLSGLGPGGETVYTPHAPEFSGSDGVLNVRWFGAQTWDENPDHDVYSTIAWAVNLANRYNFAAQIAQPGTISTIYVPSKPGGSGIQPYPGNTVYPFMPGGIELTNGLSLVGETGTRVVEAQTTWTSSRHGLPDGSEQINPDLRRTVAGETITFDYRPVRVHPNAVRLKMKDDEALTFIRMNKEPSDPDWLPPDAQYVFTDGRMTAVTARDSSPDNLNPPVMEMGVHNIILDGNWQGNQQAWTEDWTTYEEREVMRNTPAWAGIQVSVHGGKSIPPGQQIHIRNIAVLGFGANGILGDAPSNVWHGHNILLGNSLWNHVLYQASGSYRNLTFTGFAWGHAAWYDGEIRNAVFERGVVGPYRPGYSVLSVRGADQSSGDTPRYIRDDGTEVMPGTTIDGFFVDLRESGLSSPFKGIGPNIEIRNGAIISEERNTKIWHESSNGYQSGLYPNNIIDNVVYFTSTINLQDSRIVSNINTNHSYYRNVSVVLSDAPTDADSRQMSSALTAKSNYRNDPAWNDPQYIYFENINMSNVPSYSVVDRVSILENASGMNLFIKNSTFNNTRSDIVRKYDGTGRADEYADRLDKLTIVWHNVNVNINPHHGNSLEMFWGTGRFTQVTDRLTGNTSESSGTAIANGGETELVLHTDLLWKPQETPSDVGYDGRSFTTFSGDAAGKVQSYSWEQRPSVDRDGDWTAPRLRVTFSQPLSAGESLEWESAVRPPEEELLKLALREPHQPFVGSR